MALSRNLTLDNGKDYWNDDFRLACPFICDFEWSSENHSNLESGLKANGNNLDN